MRGIDMAREFQCDKCGMTFQTDQTEDEALCDAKLYWSFVSKEDLISVCDNCWGEMNPETHKEEYGEFCFTHSWMWN